MDLFKKNEICLWNVIQIKQAKNRQQDHSMNIYLFMEKSILKKDFCV